MAVISEFRSAGGFARAPTWIDNVHLAAATAETYTVPSAARFIRMTPTVIPTYGNLAGTAAPPSSDVTDGTASFPVGGQTYALVLGGASLSLICADDCDVTIEVWK